MKETPSLEQQAKTKFTIQNKPGQTLLTAHEYVIEKFMEKHFNTKNDDEVK
jgi:hypothetical protein